MRAGDLARLVLALVALLERIGDRIERRHHRITTKYLAGCDRPAMTTRGPGRMPAPDVDVDGLLGMPDVAAVDVAAMLEDRPLRPHQLAPTPGHPARCSCGECAYRHHLDRRAD